MRSYYLFYSLLLFLQGCDVPFGHRADIEVNHADGRYVMTGLIDIPNGRAVPLDGASEKRYLHVRMITTSNDEDDSLYLETGMRFYYLLTFSDVEGKETSSIKAIRWSYDYDEKHFQEHQWLRINDSTGLLAVLEMDSSRGVTTRVMLSNVMKSNGYREELDTIRYIYRPKFN